VNKIIGVIALLAAMSLSAMAQTQQPIRVNCGGPSYTDSKGQVWQADTGFVGGISEILNTKITGTPDPLLYQDFHWNPTSYSFTVANGPYQVNLYFAEANPTAQVVGGRVFNVSVQSQMVFPSLDIFAAAGANAALIKTATPMVINGKLTIGFTPVSGFEPKISAIEILPAAPPSLTLNFKYPDGTPVSGNLTYTITSSLLTLQGATPLINGEATAALFANPSSMGLSTQFQVKLNLMDTAGHVLWEITLGMNPSEVNLGAVQSSSLNVVVQKI